jgi:pimeloyl-ACP methyl ester carboxylesterase
VSVPPTLQLPPEARRARVEAGAGELAALVAEPPENIRPGAPVLLVPGYTGSKEDFLPVLGPLARAGHRTVAIDLRGQHESGGPEDPAAYTLVALAKDVAEVLAGLGGAAHLVGHSYGGLVCRQAVLDGARPLTLTLLGSGPAALGGPRAAMVELMRPVLDEGGAAGLAQAADRANRSNPKYADVAPDVMDFLARRLGNSPVAALRTMGEQLVTATDATDELRATGVTVLVAHGETDDAWTPAEQKAMAERLGASYVSIAGAVHSPACETPEATVATLLDFWVKATATP